MRRLVWWLQWHRRLGAVVALLVMLLAVTGILINHSQSMGWHLQPVHSSLVARLYGIPLQMATEGFAVQEHWLIQVGEELYLDQQPVQTCDKKVLGAVSLSEMIAVICGERLLLLDETGGLIEQLNSVPAQAQAMAVQNDAILLQTLSGNFAYHDDSGEWQAATSESDWVKAQSLPPALKDYFSHLTVVPGLTRERVLLDLHSGRLFGRLGVWVVDLVGVVTCLLAFSGMYAWTWRTLRHRKRH